MRTGVSDQPDAGRYDAERKKTLDSELARFIRILKEQADPEKVILFGTLAGGVVHEWSDIDLVVVEKTDLPFFERLRRIRKLFRPKVGMDVMVYTPEEFDRLCAERPFFRDEIVAKGEVVYERRG